MSYSDLALAGQPLPCQIIDAHTHICPNFSDGFEQKKDKIDLAEHIKLMDQLGMDCIVTAPHGFNHGYVEEANMAVAVGHDRFPGRVYGYFSIVPYRGIDVIRQEFAKYQNHPAFVGIKLLPGYHGHLDQKEYEYALDFADEASCPVLVHLWDDDPPLSQMVDILDRHHNLQLLFGHQGGGYAEQTQRCIPIVQNYENAYIEICGSFNNTCSADDMVQMFGADRVIFGTDSISHDPKYEFGWVVFSQMSDEEKAMVFGGSFLNTMKHSQLSRIPVK